MQGCGQLGRSAPGASRQPRWHGTGDGQAASKAQQIKINGPARRHAVFTTTDRQPKDNGRRVYGLAAGVGLVTTALLVTGCASSNSAKSGGTLPKLHIGTSTGATAGSVAAGAMMAPAPAAVAPGTVNNGPGGIAGPVTGRLATFGGYVLAGTLPDQPTEAPIWQWTTGQAGNDDVTRLAAALGLTGTPQRHAYGWEVATSTGDLRVSDAAGHPWSYARGSSGSCLNYSVDIDNANNAASGCAIAVPAPDSTTPPANGPDDAATKAATASLLAAIGITGDEEVSVGAPSSELTVAPVVGGLPTQGIETTVDVDASGIVDANGTLNLPTAGDNYPLRTAKSAFADLATEPRPMIAMYCGPIPVDGPVTMTTAQVATPPAPNNLAVPQVAGPVTTTSAAPSANPAVPASPAEPPTLIATPSPVESPTFTVDSPQPCPSPEPTKITGATLGLQIAYDATSDGSSIMVPAWFFSTADSSAATSVVAIAPAYLDGPATPTPPAVASPAVGASSSPGFTGGGAVGSPGVAFPPAVPGPTS
jgi:hypothetical protein